MTQAKSWLINALTFYRQFDFFGEQSALSNSELADTILENQEFSNYLEIHLISGPDHDRLTGVEEMDEWLVLNEEVRPDIWLLSLDKTRVWWDDGEKDITPDSKVYKEFLARLSAISRGSWVVSNIREIWQGNELQFVEFRWEDDVYQLSTQAFYGWIDFEVLFSINELIEASGYQFHTAPTGDQTTFIVALSEKERSAFEERGWVFDEG